MATKIGDDAEAKGRVTPDESDDLILSDIILAGCGRNQPAGAGAVGGIPNRAAA